MKTNELRMMVVAINVVEKSVELRMMVGTVKFEAKESSEGDVALKAMDGTIMIVAISVESRTIVGTIVGAVKVGLKDGVERQMIVARITVVVKDRSKGGVEATTIAVVVKRTALQTTVKADRSRHEERREVC
jgi:hypothetical protein